MAGSQSVTGRETTATSISHLTGQFGIFVRYTTEQARHGVRGAEKEPTGTEKHAYTTVRIGPPRYAIISLARDTVSPSVSYGP